MSQISGYFLGILSESWGRPWRPGTSFVYTRCGIVVRRGMVSFKANFPLLHELFAKHHRGPFAPPSGARVNPRPDRGVQQGGPWGFSQIAKKRRFLGYLMGQTLRNFWLKKLTRSGQVTELWRHKRNNLRQGWYNIGIFRQNTNRFGIWFLWLPFHWYRFGFGLDRNLGKDSGIRFGRV